MFTGYPGELWYDSYSSGYVVVGLLIVPAGGSMIDMLFNPYAYSVMTPLSAVRRHSAQYYYPGTRLSYTGNCLRVPGYLHSGTPPHCA